MRYRPLGDSGIQASVIGFGAMAIGGWAWGGTDEAESIAAVRYALDKGINLIDTAPVYGVGLSEELVGKAIAGRRDKAIVATKCGLVWHTDKGDLWIPDAMGKVVHRYQGPESIRYEIEQSLRRLGTDYIDLYQTHWQDPSTPIEDTMAALLDLKQQGKIRAIGVSNASVADLERYRKLGSVASGQELYSMLDRGIEKEVLPYCHNHGIAILAYSPLANGLLTGQVEASRQFKPGDYRAKQERFSVENRQRINRMLSEFQPIAETHGITMAQLVIAWTLAQPGLTHALCGARKPAQVDENARAGDVELSEGEIATINEVLKSYLD